MFLFNDFISTGYESFSDFFNVLGISCFKSHCYYAVCNV